MQSLHPLPHTNPFDGTTRKQAPRKDILMSKQTYFLLAPYSSLWVRGNCVGQKVVSQTGVTRGPE